MQYTNEVKCFHRSKNLAKTQNIISNKIKENILTLDSLQINTSNKVTMPNNIYPPLSNILYCSHYIIKPRTFRKQKSTLNIF